ncbi:MAG: hypothetical protein ACREJ2_04785 [Planctomycetota bacterium]
MIRSLPWIRLCLLVLFGSALLGLCGRHFGPVRGLGGRLGAAETPADGIAGSTAKSGDPAGANGATGGTPSGGAPTSPTTPATPAPPAVPAVPAVTPEQTAELNKVREAGIAAIGAKLKSSGGLQMELSIDGQARLVQLESVDAKGGLIYSQYGQPGRLDLTVAQPRMVADLLVGLVNDDDDAAAQMHMEAGLLYNVDGKFVASAAQLDKAETLDPTLSASAEAAMKKLPKPAPPVVNSPDLSKLVQAEQHSAPGTNQAGRALGALPKISSPILSGDPAADAVMANLQLLPKNHALYDDITKCPVLANSDRIIANIGANEVLNPDYSFNYVIVPGDQRPVAVAVPKTDETDTGPFPVPANLPIEGWGPPKAIFGNHMDLKRWQESADTGDRHAIVVDPYNGSGPRFLEFYHMRLVSSGWDSRGAYIWPCNSLATRRPRTTSADAAGLPILPTLVRYDELQRGMVEHAMRFCVPRTRKAFLYPACHYAATATPPDDPDQPAMGERLRLKANVNIDSFGPQSRAIALALKKYGMIVADNGDYRSICLVADDRLDDPDIKHLRLLKMKDFEVVRGYGPQEGPRAP